MPGMPGCHTRTACHNYNTACNAVTTLSAWTHVTTILPSAPRLMAPLATSSRACGKAPCSLALIRSTRSSSVSPRFCKRHSKESNEERGWGKRKDVLTTAMKVTRGCGVVGRAADTYNRDGFLKDDRPSVNARVDKVDSAASDGATGLKRLLLGVHPYSGIQGGHVRAEVDESAYTGYYYYG